MPKLRPAALALSFCLVSHSVTAQVSAPGCEIPDRLDWADKMLFDVRTELSAMDDAGEDCISNWNDCFRIVGVMSHAMLYIDDFFDNNHDWQHECMKCDNAYALVRNRTQDFEYYDLFFDAMDYHIDTNFRNYDFTIGQYAGLPVCGANLVSPPPPPPRSTRGPVPAGGNAGAAGGNGGSGGGGLDDPDVIAGEGTGFEPGTSDKVATHPCAAYDRGERPAEAVWNWYSFYGVGGSNFEVGGYLCGTLGFIEFDGSRFSSQICESDYSVNCRPNDYFNATVTDVVSRDDGGVEYHYESDSGSVGYGVRSPR
ncbi:hypothetical protein [Frigidibacter sp. ROC022]|uniref:hypothetical protein n=1 Tax=Frigidibacter sp. ROC022 TaxID=2971796 RepID=UPI00215B7235|nr:hypothetical protein [Frigidibacter sp. ROC022]MCR8725467.1 hypothetical protein [Frigidibacter sp. ROC022]